MSGKRLYRTVVEKMLVLIDSGEYPVGSRLPPERELAERFNVSRPTIREAVIALEAKGRIAVKGGSGMYVSDAVAKKKITSGVASPFELMEARVVVEGEVAALAASMITSEELESLRDVLVDMAKENKQEELGADSADRKFHSIIARATNNRVLAVMVENLWTAQEDLHYIRVAHQAVCMEDIQTRLEEHQMIYNALANQDPQAARAAMRQHFTRTIDALHSATEEDAVKAVRQKLSLTRERFSADRLTDSTLR